LDFSVDEDTFYAASGFYDVNDVVEPGEVYMWISLYDLTESRYNFFILKPLTTLKTRVFMLEVSGEIPKII